MLNDVHILEDGCDSRSDVQGEAQAGEDEGVPEVPLQDLAMVFGFATDPATIVVKFDSEGHDHGHIQGSWQNNAKKTQLSGEKLPFVFQKVSGSLYTHFFFLMFGLTSRKWGLESCETLMFWRMHPELKLLKWASIYVKVAAATAIQMSAYLTSTQGQRDVDQNDPRVLLAAGSVEHVDRPDSKARYSQHHDADW